MNLGHTLSVSSKFVGGSILLSSPPDASTGLSSSLGMRGCLRVHCHCVQLLFSRLVASIMPSLSLAASCLGRTLLYHSRNM
jgi:hypothetical protein